MVVVVVDCGGGSGGQAHRGGSGGGGGGDKDCGGCSDSIDAGGECHCVVVADVYSNCSG